jgi:hypothetical protein
MSAIAKPFPAPRHKPRRPGPFMAALSAAQKETLFSWLAEDNAITYAAAQERIWRNWKIKCSLDQLGQFWQHYCSPRLLQPIAANGHDGVLLEIVIQVRRRKGEP